MKSLFVLILLAFSFVGQSQIINFPDPNFKNALVNDLCVDTNGDGIGDADADLNDDGEIEMDEVKSLKFLDVNLNFITNLDGIVNFRKLEVLKCAINQLTSLNLQGLANLKRLECYQNKLKSLNIQGLTNLAHLECDENQLTSLNVQELTNLERLICSKNQLTSLNVNGLTKLNYLSCGTNQLTSLFLEGTENLLNLYCYDNKLTSLNVQELEKLEFFDCGKNQLTSIDIQGFGNLVELNCEKNKLTSLNVQGLTNLKVLNCRDNSISFIDLQVLSNLQVLEYGNNQLNSLNVQGLTNLQSLYCYGNQLTSLNVTGLTNLRELNCVNNFLTSLDLQGLVNLKGLGCSNNFLATLNIQGLKNLRNLFCYDNQLASLNVTGLTNLEFLNCSNNFLTYLDLQDMANLIFLDCTSNNLSSLFLKGTNIINIKYNLNFKKNINLSFICCNDYQIKEIKAKTVMYGQNCEVNSYCSFTPGGKFFILQGNNAYDRNNNDCENNDIKIPNIKYNITNANLTGTFISNSTGNYSIPVQEGTHTITPILEDPNHYEVTPSSFTVTFPSTSDTITQNFCITPKGILRQTNITVIPLSPPARPGFDASYKIVWENVGNQIESGTLNFTYDETLLDYISASQIADQVADGIVKWNFSNLLPFEKREITVTLKVNRPTDTPTVNAGDKLYLTASILDNIFTLENTVVGSYDPNDKTCLQGDRVKPDMVGKYVDYLIRFENTGNYAAENVVVKDIIDTKTFDVSSLQITDASHEVYTRIEGNKVEFIFENIQLPFDDANNDGYVAFKIKTLPTLVLGDSLKNLADIYFDYNFPIRTNEAQTTIALPSFTKDIATEVNVYPNPVRDIIYLESNENWSKAEIYDISGRILRSVSLDGQSIDVSGLESGTYFIKLKDGEKVGVVKFVKM